MNNKAPLESDPRFLPFFQATDKAGAERELERLITEITPLIEAVIRKYTRSQGGEFQQDHVQSVLSQVIILLRGMKAGQREKDISNFPAYVSVMAKHFCQKNQPWQDWSESLDTSSRDGDEQEEARPLRETESGSGLLPDERLAIKEYLTLWWREVENLPRFERMAYLLNFSLLGAELALVPFVEYEVTSMRRIGWILGLSDEHFARIWPELSLSETDRRELAKAMNHDENFAILWKYLPLPDLTIAGMLGKTRQQIINLRDQARRRIAQRLSKLVQPA